MINQTIKNNDYRASLDLSDIDVDSGVALTVRKPDDTVLINSGEAILSDGSYIYDIDSASSTLATTGTYTLEWSYESLGTNKFQTESLDVLDDDYTRYCYQNDVKNRMYDVTLPSDLDVGDITREASSEVNRALQGFYVLPLSPDSTNASYNDDVTAIRKLTSDIAVGILADRLSSVINNTTKPQYNHYKAVAYAELKRYVSMEKVFPSVEKDTTHDNVSYEGQKADYSAPRYVDGNNNSYDSPFDQIYNNFGPINK